MGLTNQALDKFSKNKERVLSLIRECLDMIELPSAPTERSVISIMRLPGAMYVPDTANEKIEEIIRAIIADTEISKKYSRGRVKNRFLELLRELKEMETYVTPESLHAKMREFIKSFEKCFERASYHIFVENLLLESELRLGEVVLRPFSASEFEYLRAHVSKPKGDALLKDFESYATPLIGKCSLAKIDLTVESLKGYELSPEKLEEALNVLRFFGSSVYPRKVQPRIGISVLSSTKRIYKLTESEMFGMHIEHTGRGPFQLINNVLNKLDERGFPFVVSIMKKRDSDRSHIEKSLLVSINAFGQTLTGMPLTSNFMNLVIALEAIFQDGDRQEIAYKLANRVSVFLGRDSATRKRIFGLLKDAYKVRSQLVHGELPKDLADYYDKLERYVFLSILQLISLLEQNQSQWRTTSQFIDWLEEKKFSL